MMQILNNDYRSASLALVWDTQMSLQVSGPSGLHILPSDGGFGLLPIFCRCRMSRTLSRRDKRTVRFPRVSCSWLSAEPGSWDGSLWGKVTPLPPRHFASILGIGSFFSTWPKSCKVDILRFVAMACWHNFINTWERAGRKIWILEGGSFSSDMVILDLPPVSVWNGSWYCGDNGWDSSFASKKTIKQNSQILCKVKGRQSQLTLGPLKVFILYSWNELDVRGWKDVYIYIFRFRSCFRGHWQKMLKV